VQWDAVSLGSSYVPTTSYQHWYTNIRFIAEIPGLLAVRSL